MLLSVCHTFFQHFLFSNYAFLKSLAWLMMYEHDKHVISFSEIHIFQQCFVRFGSWIYDVEQLNLVLKQNQVDLSEYVANSEFDLVRQD